MPQALAALRCAPFLALKDDGLHRDGHRHQYEEVWSYTATAKQWNEQSASDRIHVVMHGSPELLSAPPLKCTHHALHHLLTTA